MLRKKGVTKGGLAEVLLLVLVTLLIGRGTCGRYYGYNPCDEEEIPTRGKGLEVDDPSTFGGE